MGGGGGGGGHGGKYTNPCLTMHQPWASLLVYGIKRIEGRSWPAPIRGRLWIHAASKIPDQETVKAMEDFYREIYAVNGVNDIKFPEHYPVSRLIGCVEVVGCVTREELANWDAVPEGVRLEGQTDFCWLCEHPQRLLIPFEMRGYQRVYNLEKRVFEAAVRGLGPIKNPMPVKFPLPNPRDIFSLKPGSISALVPGTKAQEEERSSRLNAAIAGARAAANQFNKRSSATCIVQNNDPCSSTCGLSTSKDMEEDKLSVNESHNCDDHQSSESSDKAICNMLDNEKSSSPGYKVYEKRLPEAPSKLFAAAMRGLKPS